jgi:hypothetical protein
MDAAWFAIVIGVLVAVVCAGRGLGWPSRRSRYTSSDGTVVFGDSGSACDADGGGCDGGGGDGGGGGD